jgi:hypothetical protein
MEIETNTIPLKPDGTAKVVLWTTTDDMMDEEDGCVHYEIDHGDKKYVAHVLNREFSEPWGRRFLKAFAMDPEFRALFLHNPDCRMDTDYPKAPGKITLPALPSGTQEAVTREDVRALKRKGQKAAFKDFASLRSGRDAFSRLTLEALRVQCGASALVDGALDEDADKAKAYRWIARGLSDWMAVRKVKTDLEITANAKHPKKHR